MSIIDNSPRTSTAMALEDTVVIPIDAETFQEKLGSSDPMAYMFLRVIAGRYRWALRRALDNQNINSSKTMMMGGMDTRYMRVRESAISRLRIEQDLQEAIEKDQFVVYYQPIVTMTTGVIAGFEALLRWNHPERGIIAPGEFVGVAEESGLIIPIGSWVIEKACEDLPRFQDVFNQNFLGQPELFMSVNVSPKQIDKLSKLDRLKAILDTHGTDPGNIKLEITEDLLVTSPELAVLALDKIKATGVELALDDFGTGYSSMSYLHRFPLDVLKIDRTFINAVNSEEKGLEIVQGIIGLARALRMQVVAEGVEDLETLNKIRHLDCDYLQGFFASKPWPLEAMLASLARHCRSRAKALAEQPMVG
ncbi:MAG: EAL domain-containing protein [Gammaproteobacteria bacterium]|nr:EAL domain-containing protein [Gammaproteobacteria bacterium]